jgi:hypothetical protein
MRRCTFAAALAVLLMVCFFPLSTDSAAADEAPEQVVANVIWSPHQLTWEPQIPYAYASISLVVSGPGDVLLQKTFAPGEPLALPAVFAAGNALPRGSYTYSLSVTPFVGPEAQAVIDADAEGRDPTVTVQLQEQGLLPRGPFLQSGTFAVLEGHQFADPSRTEEISAGEQSIEAATGFDSADGAVIMDQVISDDLIVNGSACIGFDCANGESFGFDTIRIKENNLRIKAQDTSSTADFPGNDWQLTFNDSSNGGANKFSIDDIDGGRTPFTLEAGAPSHSLYVDDAGRLGLGTSTPIADVHMQCGSTPTMRLAQDGSFGWAPQTWDVAGNEANFFIRDVTNGSKLPFRVRPSAPTSSIDVGPAGDVGFGTSSPTAAIHISRSDGGASILVEDEAPDAATDKPDLLELRNEGNSFMMFTDASQDPDRAWLLGISGANVGFIAGDSSPLVLSPGGDLVAEGNLLVGGVGACAGCDVARTALGLAEGQTVAELATVPIYAVEDSITGGEDAFFPSPGSGSFATRHLVPAGVFNEKFGLGAVGLGGIAPLDVATMAVMGVQDLYQLAQAQATAIAQQQAVIDAQAAQLQQLDALPGQMDQLAQTQATAIAQQQAAIDAQAAQLQQLDALPGQMDQLAQTQATAIAQQQAAIDAQTAQLQQVSALPDQMEQFTEAQTTTVAQQQATIAAQTTQLQQMATRLGEAEQLVQTQGATIDAQAIQLQQMAARLDAMEQRIERLESMSHAHAYMPLVRAE